MKRTHTQIVAELKQRLDAYIADPENTSEVEIQRLIQELDWARNPEQGPRPDPADSPKSAAQPEDGTETSGAS